MAEYNEAVQWLHDNPCKHKSVKLRNGTVVIAMNTDFLVERPIAVQSGSDDLMRVLGRSGCLHADGTYSEWDIVGFTDPKPEVWYRKPGDDVFFTQKELEDMREGERALYSERVHVIPAPLEEQSDG